jgi:hypothetical protein
MSTKPSWLDDEENQTRTVAAVKAVAANPAAQKAAKDPKVQAAVKDAFVAAAVSASSDPSAPAWAADSYTPPSVPGAAASPTDRQSMGNPDPSSGKEFECDPEILRDMKRWHLGLRIAYMIAAVLLGLAGGLELSHTPSLGTFFFCFYVMFFALIICCFEIGLDVSYLRFSYVGSSYWDVQAISRIIAINFGFLYTVPGKMAFLLFVGFMSFSLGLVGQIAMAYLYAVYLFQLYIYFKFPR